MLLFFLWIFQVYACQEWQCADLAPEICAEWSEKFVKVNTSQCPGGKKCYLLGLELEKNWKAEGKYYCEDFILSPSTPSINCNVRKPANKYLSAHPIKCYKDDQCKTAKSQKNCICSMDGNGYCELLEGDFEVNKYYDTCYILNNKEAFAWYLYMDLFPLLHQVPRCAQRLFTDLQVIISYSHMLGLNYTSVFQ